MQVYGLKDDQAVKLGYGSYELYGQSIQTFTMQT